MTKRPYPAGWTAGSKVHGLAASPADCAWNVNFNNGNANWNNRNNNGFVRAVRASECQGVTFRQLHTAWLEARRGKRPSGDRIDFDTHWIDRLLELQDAINSFRWCPSAPTCFIASQPKAREIHAPAFADRVVHHWVVPIVEALFEPTFIHDSFSNRRGKGTHAAVDRLQAFARQVSSGQGPGWYLQLDVRNFFSSIHRATLWGQLRKRLHSDGGDPIVARTVHALLRRSPLHYGVTYACRPHERALVPAHKRLENSAPGCGIAIGNLSSQFFANVYLDALDQFVKHELGARRYIRYVDDFVLVDVDGERLLEQHERIVDFLRDELRLELKPDARPRPLSGGIDFLGYVVWPTHRVPRRRVVAHCRAKLTAWQRAHVRGRRRRQMSATPAEYSEIRSIWTSYAGHFSHAASSRLVAGLERDFPWLRRAAAPASFDHRLDGRRVVLSAHIH